MEDTVMIDTYASRLSQLDFYPHWSALPDHQQRIDPFLYSGRLSVYKAPIDAMNAGGAFGADNEMNIFWGYVFQLAWQWRSGRLTLRTTPPGHIDSNSMWGYANYALSVIPLIAAIEIGMIPPVEIAAPPERSAVEYAHGDRHTYIVPSIFGDAVQQWKHFFDAARQLKPGGDVEPLFFLQWEAHHQSLLGAEVAMLKVGTNFHSRDEMDFLIGWVRMVDFLGPAAWRTDLAYMLEHAIGVLPERPITSADTPGRIKDMSPEVNANLISIIGLTKQSKLRFGFNLFLWKRAMRTAQARAEVLPMLDATFNPSPRNAVERRKLLRYILKP